jgi:glycine/D-amino acid oxidase-like deaminating enzyme/nitrite reductase/ring-hydroxylating ferredoxin subunit
MTATTSADSLWLATASDTVYPTLAAGLHVDVAIVGGGVAGLTTALMLRRAGARVAVLEAGRVGRGVTGCTTAKVTALQSTIYSTIQGRHGRAAASVYAEASAAGVEELAAIVAEYAIECELGRRDAYTFAATPDEAVAVEKEAEAAARAGLPVELADPPDLPFASHGAVRLADQLQIHPVRYAQGLAKAIEGDGNHIFEQTRVLDVHEGRPCRLRTAAGDVTADHVVIATHYPILDRGLYFARLKPERSYCVAARLRSGRLPDSMAISVGSPSRSIRSSGEALIVGGEGHATGSAEASPERFERLIEFANEHWDVAEIVHRWSAQDPVHYDHLPVIGSYRPGSTRLWVATGFMKWGFSTATFAARILTDRLNGRSNDWSATFSPTRLAPRSLPEAAQLGAKFTTDLVGDRLKRPQVEEASEVPIGAARVVADGRARKGVYRSADGTLHAVSLRCPHMGCLLRFNPAETSWDCPCHGSRFDVDGAVLEGPAVRDLDKRDP